jgi:hypothetical protein
MAAWAPDTSVPTDMVTAGQGTTYPVLGTEAWNKIPAGQTVCHYGAGSFTQVGAAEQCTQSSTFTPYARNDGLVFEPMFGAGADSGGPVYAYHTDSQGQRDGFYAIGDSCHRRTDMPKQARCHVLPCHPNDSYSNTVEPSRWSQAPVQEGVRRLCHTPSPTLRPLRCCDQSRSLARGLGQTRR